MRWLCAMLTTMLFAHAAWAGEGGSSLDRALREAVVDESDTTTFALAGTRDETAQARGRAIVAVGRLPLSFVAACPASATAPAFHARGIGYHVMLSADGARIGVLRGAGAQSQVPAIDVAHIRFVGARADASGQGDDPLPGRIHRLRSGADGGECTDLQGYARVRFASVYPGIDVVYYGTGQEIEFDFVVAPGADPQVIRLAIDRAEHTAIDADGNLVVRIGEETLRLRRPVAYQQSGAVREEVATRYVLRAGNEAALQVIAYDRKRTLTIDPILSYATYLGGTKNDYPAAIAVDASGNAYVAGYTTSADFPLVSAYDKALATGDVDAFVTKIGSGGKTVVYSTFLGSAAGVDRAVGIAVDASGYAYVTGTTTGGFPVTAGAYQSAITGTHSFVAKLVPAGSALVYSTYLQGVEARGIAVDASGSAYVAGRATSTFATTANAYQRTPGGAFVLKLDPSGTSAGFATYLGGGGANEAANAIAVDAQGAVYVVGATDSPSFPTRNALQSRLGGGLDGFVVKLVPSGSSAAYATYLGGALDDAANAVAVDVAGNVYVAGETYSADYPVGGALQPVKAGARLATSALGSAFVSKLEATGDRLAYSTFLGGEVCSAGCSAGGASPQTPGDAAYAIAVDAQGHAYVAGLARSYTFPLANSLRSAKTKDTQDSAFVAKLALSGGALLYSTLTRTGTAAVPVASSRFPLGAATGVAVDGSGAAYVVGDADSLSDFKATTGAYQSTNGGGQGGVALKLAGPVASLTLTASAIAVVAPATITLTATASGATLSGNVVFMDGPGVVGTVALKSNNAVLTTALSVGLHRLSAVFLGAGNEIDSAIVNVIVDNALVCTAPA